MEGWNVREGVWIGMLAVIAAYLMCRPHWRAGRGLLFTMRI